MTEPKHQYIAAAAEGRHVVFVVHADTPLWWRKIASFADADRAQTYAEFQNEIRDEGDEKREPDVRPATKDLPQPPKPLGFAHLVEAVKAALAVAPTEAGDWQEAAAAGILIRWRSDEPSSVPQAYMQSPPAAPPADDPMRAAAMAAPPVAALQPVPLPQPVPTVPAEALPAPVEVFENGKGWSEPDEPEARDTAAIEVAVLDHIKAEVAAGVRVRWPSLLKVAKLSTLQLGELLDGMAGKRMIVRNVHGIRPYGVRAPEPVAQPQAKPPGVKSAPSPSAPLAPNSPLDAPAPADGAKVDTAGKLPNPAPAPVSALKTEEELIAEYLASKGTSRASEERVTIEDIIAELQKGGRKVSPAGAANGAMFKVGGQRMTRADMFMQANKLRVMRGVPVWDSRRVDGFVL